MELLTFNLNTLPRVRLIGQVAYKEPFKHFSRTTNEYIFFFVKSGELYIQEEEAQYILKKGDCLLLEPNKKHVGFKEASCRYFFIHFKHPEIDNLSITQQQLVNVAIKNRKDSLSSDCFSETAQESAICYLPKQYAIVNPSEIFELLSAANADFYSHYECYKNYASWKLTEIILKLSREYISTSIIAKHPRYSRTYAKVTEIVNYIHSNYARKLSSAEIRNNLN